MTYYIYLLTLSKSVHCKANYIGLTSKLNDRFLKHKSELRANRHHCKKLQEYYNEWCRDDNFEVSVKVLEKTSDLEEGKLLEEKYIKDNVKSLDLCNSFLTGIFDEEASNRMKGLWADEEYRKHMSEVRRETWNDKDYREKISKAMREAWADEKCRASRVKQIRKITKSKEYRELHSRIGKDRWSNEEWRGSRMEFYKSYQPPNSEEVCINGIVYSSYSKAAESLKINHHTVIDRVMSKDPKWRHYVSNKNPIKEHEDLDWSRVFIINGELFFDIMSIAKKYDISHPTVRRRVNSNNLLFVDWLDYSTYVNRFGLDNFKELLEEQHPTNIIVEEKGCAGGACTL